MEGLFHLEISAPEHPPVGHPPVHGHPVEGGSEHRVQFQHKEEKQPHSPSWSEHVQRHAHSGQRGRAQWQQSQALCPHRDVHAGAPPGPP